MYSRSHKIRVGGILDISTIDWYGNISLVVFFAGCNFRCPYCHNPRLLPLNSGINVDLELLRKRIEMNLPLLDSVVFSGGELLLQSESVLEAAKLVKSFGLKLMLDTNGSIPTVAKRLFETGLVDRVALDVKAPLTPEEYQKVACSQLNGLNIVNGIKKTIELCNFYNIEIEVRTTIAPSISDSEKVIKCIANEIKDRCDVYYLQQFDNTGEIYNQQLKSILPPSRERMLELAKIAISEGLNNVYIKTREHGLERVG